MQSCMGCGETPAGSWVSPALTNVLCHDCLLGLADFIAAQHPDLLVEYQAAVARQIEEGTQALILLHQARAASARPAPPPGTPENPPHGAG